MDLTLILGPMKSGKSFDLISHFAPLQYTDLRFALFQSSRNVRDETVWSRSGAGLAARKVANLRSLLREDLEVVGVDEIHMFSAKDVAILKTLLNQGTRVVASGLDMDYRGKMFGVVRKLLELGPAEVRYKRAVCEVCRQPEAIYTQVLRGKEPVVEGIPSVIPEDGTYSYMPVCRGCFFFTPD